MNDRPLSAVVEKPRTQAAIGSLRAEGVYDDARSVYECGSPVSRITSRTAVSTGGAVTGMATVPDPHS